MSELRKLLEHEKLEIKTSYNTMLAIDYLNLALEQIERQVINKEPIKQHIQAILELKSLLIKAVKEKMVQEVR
ncbi:hypothetical protein DRP05_12090 [Archaeoglobales archaeon]|nr:MAG: hypothetical protein DRP05_12090 [Archaeoglobales archaeon]